MYFKNKLKEKERRRKRKKEKGRYWKGEETQSFIIQILPYILI